MRFLRQSLTVAAKDLRAEFRTKESLNAAVAFAVVILLLFSFTTDVSAAETLYEMSGGLLWLVFAFAGALILNRSFARELPNDCLDTLVASPVSGAALFLGKAMANFLLLLIVEFLCLPVFGVFYNIRWAQQLGALSGVLLLATWGMTVIGTAFSALTVNLRLRELMLPTLVYPVLIPALLPAIQLTAVLISGEPLGADMMMGLRLLVAFDIIFTALALALTETILMG
jgi:heme exporter protein B